MSQFNHINGFAQLRWEAFDAASKADEPIKKDAPVSLAKVKDAFKNGHDTFPHSRNNGRSKDGLTQDDVPPYCVQVRDELSEDPAA